VVPVALRLTVRELFHPFEPVVLDCTLPPARLTLRVALLPFEPVTVVLRSRACATAGRALALANAATMASSDRMRPQRDV
jgi:hypothetical protein